MNSGLRSYHDAHDRVRALYLNSRKHHSLRTIAHAKEKYAPKGYYPIEVWGVLAALSQFTDLSDPDVGDPNMQHALQTAESIRAQGLPDWMQLTGLIHDFGKVLFLAGCNEDGTSLETQWGIVGDTYVVGLPLPPDIVYPEFNRLAPVQYTGLGVYKRGCGLDCCAISYGHDEYLYSALVASKHSLPDVALRAIRYHSLYPWHEGGHYHEIESDADRDAQRWVKLLNEHDLYSKTDQHVELDSVRAHYDHIIQKYLPEGINFGEQVYLATR